jgi:hypothetical protein
MLDWRTIYSHDEFLTKYLRACLKDLFQVYADTQKMSNAPEVSPLRRIRLREAANYLFEGVSAISNTMNSRGIAHPEGLVDKEEPPTDNYAATCATYAALFDRVLLELHERQLDKRAPHDVYTLHNILLKKGREIYTILSEGSTPGELEFGRRLLGEQS